MHRHRSARLLTALALLGILFTALPAAIAQEPVDLDRIEAALLDTLNTEGTAGFFVVMAETADLSAAFEIEDWSERGWYVYSALREMADRTQAPVVAYAEEQGLQYRTFLTYNAVFIEEASLAQALDLAALPGVAQLHLQEYAQIDPLFRDETPAVPTAYQWNLDTLDPASSLYGMQAAQAWSAYGVRGEGIVVGNIDTGAYYQHEALDRQYRGNLTGQIGGPYDHNYSWWDPINGQNAAYDDHGHGSGTIGIMSGETLNLAEQIGVAPGTQWIACKGCNSSGGCPSADLLECFDFHLAPWDLTGANPNPSLRPHIVNNSWGGSGCSTTYRTAIQAWVAAGIFPAFSAGNTVGCSTVGSPGDNPEAFGTAAHDTTGTNLYAGGPSCFFNPPSCDPYAHEIDPHLNAPTFGRTADNCQGCYYNLSGTSGASPHTAGTVALIWSGNPSYIGQIYNTFYILEQSTNHNVPLESCGKPACAGSNDYPNYDFGWGYLDALAALDLAGVGGEGTLEGTVTEAAPLDSPGDPLEGITITAERQGGGSYEATTGATGYYSVTLVNGTYTVTAEGPQHGAQTVYGIVVTTGTVTVQNFQLQPLGLLYGYVTDADSGAPLEATVSAGGIVTPTDPATGYYMMYLDAGTYDVTAEATDYASQTVSVDIIAGQATQQDFELVAAVAVVPDPIAITLELFQIGTVGSVITNNMAVDYGFQFMESGPPGGMAVQQADILLLGDDVNAAGWDTYRNALSAAGYAWDEWNLDSLAFPTLADLAPYSVLIVFDESSMAYGDAPCQILADWLQSGGKSLFATSIDWLWDLENGTVGNGEHNLYLLFATEYLGDYAGSGISAMEGVPGDLIGGSFAPPSTLTLAANADSNGDYANQALSTAVTGLLYGAGGTGSGYSGLTHYDAGTYKTVWLGINYHNGLTDQAQRDQLMANIMAFFLGGDVPWYGTSIDSGTVPANGGSLQWTNTFTASPALGVDQPGIYEATLRVLPDNPSHPTKEVAVVMTVLPTADMGLLEGTVTSDRPGGPLEATIVMGDGTYVYTTTADPDTGDYGFWLTAGSYDVTASYPGYVSQTVSLAIYGGMTTTQDFVLELNQPGIVVTPASMEETLPFGDWATQTLNIANIGLLPLEYEIMEIDLGYEPQGLCQEYYGGDLGSIWTGGTRDRGNFFEITEPTVINEIFAYLNFASPTDVYYVVYEADSLVGTYSQLFTIHVTDVGPGEQWYSSGPIAVPVEAGKFYYVGASWNASGNYYRNTTNPTPYTTLCFGTLHTGQPATLAGYPPAATFNNTYGSGYIADYGFGIATGGGDVPWLSEDPISGTVQPGMDVDVEVTFDAGVVAEPGTYMAEMRITHNDPLTDPVTVPVTMTVQPSGDTGKLEGIVSGLGYCDGDSYPLEADILIESSTGMTWTTVSDPTGYYYRWLDAGTYTVTASAAEHVDATAVVQITALQTTTQDFDLRWIESCMDVTPLSFDVTILVDTQWTETLSIYNDGAGELLWEIRETTGTMAVLSRQAPSGQQPAPRAEEPVITSEADCALYENYVGAEPLGYAEYCMPELVPAGTDSPLPLGPTDIGYALEMYSTDNIVTFVLNDFPGQTVVGPQSRAIYAMDFDQTATMLYAIDNTAQELGTISLADGSFTAIGPCIPQAGHTWTGLTIDPRNNDFYASSTDGTAAALYTVDPATGATTLIGTNATVPYLIDIAMNPDGEMYGHDISTDSIYQIDYTTFVVNLIGATGFAANYAQGLDFDNDDGTLYIFLYQGTGANVYGTVDLTTGAVTPLSQNNPMGEFEGAIQIPGVEMWIDVPWVSEVPTAGVTLPDSVYAVDVVFDSTGLTVDECYTASLGLLHDDPGWDSPTMIPLTLCVVLAVTPTASFETSSPVCLGEAMVFTDTSGNEPTAWTWMFGDGESSTEQHPTHTYAAADSYTVTLEACNVAGCDSTSEQVEVWPLPTAGFTTMVDGLTVTFTNASANATAYLWEFGDGLTDTVANPVHIYAAAGTYTVTLTVTGPCGTDQYQAVLQLEEEEPFFFIYLPLVTKGY